MSLNQSVSSFSYRNGSPPEGALVFDCRAMRNPHHVPSLKVLDGRARSVQDFVMADPMFKPLFDAALAAMVKGQSVAFGCIGGRHRSVAMAQLVGAEMDKIRRPVPVVHRALP